MIRGFLGCFRRDDRGQDLSEWCLITALIVLLSFGVFYYFSGGMQNLWGNANSTLATGNQVSGATTSSTTSNPATASTPATASSPR